MIEMFNALDGTDGNRFNGMESSWDKSGEIWFGTLLQTSLVMTTWPKIDKSDYHYWYLSNDQFNYNV